MHALILEKFALEMHDQPAAKEVRYQAIIADFVYEVAVYPACDAALHKALFALSWHWHDETVSLWIPGEDVPFKKSFFIGPVTQEQWANLVTCIKIFLDFKTEGLTFSGFGNVPVETLETKPRGWHHERVSYNGLLELEPIINVLRAMGRASHQLEYNGPDERSYYDIDPENGTVDYWVRKR